MYVSAEYNWKCMQIRRRKKWRNTDYGLFS